MKFNKIVYKISEYKSFYEPNCVKLNSNENPYLSVDIMKKISEEIKNVSLNYYPEIDQFTSRNIIAEFLNISYKNIALGNGSDELINYCLKLFEGDEVIILSPSFEMYTFYSKLNNLEIKYIDFDYLNYLEKMINEKTRMIILCSPNNPCGRVIDKKIIENILKKGVPVLLDEAYVEFSYESNLDLINNYNNLIILRTLSKAYSAAGARIGYMISNSLIVGHLMKIKSPYSFSKINEIIVKIIFENYSLLKKNIDLIISEREKIKKILNLKYDSYGNFIFIENENIHNIYNKLIKEKILVRRFSHLENNIRITIGNKKQNEIVLKILQQN